MFLYEHERTKVIVLRLRALSSLIRLVVLAFWAILLGAFLALVNEMVSPGTWWVGGLLGVILGFLFGSVVAAATVAIVEWMAQLLVAQGEIVEALRKRAE